MAHSHSPRERLVTQLRERGAIRSDAVADAFGAVPRELFVPAA
jgi:protein-L-isoaspartate O-methyltransferase